MRITRWARTLFDRYLSLVPEEEQRDVRGAMIDLCTFLARNEPHIGAHHVVMAAKCYVYAHKMGTWWGTRI